MSVKSIASQNREQDMEILKMRAEASKDDALIEGMNDQCAAGTITPPQQGLAQAWGNFMQWYDNGGLIGNNWDKISGAANAVGNTCGAAWKGLLGFFK